MKTIRIFNISNLFKLLLLLPCLVFGLTISAPVHGETLDSLYTDELNMVLGELITLKVHSLTRLSVTDPKIADIVDADDEEVLIVAQSVGQTALFLWDEQGKRTLMIHVYSQDLDMIKNRIKKLFRAADIHEVVLDINEKEGKVIIAGEVPEHKKGHFDQILEPFTEDIINLVKEEEIEDLIEIDLQITELSTTLSKSLGFDWTTGSAATLSPAYQEALPGFDGSVGDFFKIGDFERTNALLATVNALLEEGKARILSKPKLVVVSGEEASFLVGGEIPVRTTTTTTAGSTQENVTFKEFGVGMTITPTIKKEKVDLVLNIEVSDIDAANAVGNDVAFTTRSADTHLYLDDGQTIVIAGLIKHNESELVKKVPFLGDVPILGLLFRNRSTPVANQDTELVLAITPNIVDRNRNPPVRLSSSDERTNYADDFSPNLGGGGLTANAQRRTSQKAAPHYMGIPEEMTAYVRSVQQKISQAIRYPHEAKEHGWEGTVKVDLLILSDGTLAFALVKESSGYEIFDEYALNTAKSSAPYSSFPSDADIQELNLTIPIVYSLRNN